jgi:hypothetical protein
MKRNLKFSFNHSLQLYESVTEYLHFKGLFKIQLTIVHLIAGHHNMMQNAESEGMNEILSANPLSHVGVPVFPQDSFVHVTL